MGRSVGLLLGFLLAVWGLGLGFLASTAAGRFVVEKNSLMVTSPSDLRGKHDSAIGNFGIPQYGGSMAGTVVYPKTNNDACEQFSASDLFKPKPGALPNFLLIDHGECLFAWICLERMRKQRDGDVRSGRDGSGVMLGTPSTDQATG